MNHKNPQNRSKQVLSLTSVAILLLLVVAISFAIFNREPFTSQSESNIDQIVPDERAVAERHISTVQLKAEKKPTIDPSTEQLVVKQDVSLDDWKTEEFSERAVGYFGRLTSVLKKTGGLQNLNANEFATQNFQADAIPTDMPIVFEDSGISVRRHHSKSADGTEQLNGLVGFSTFLQQLTSSLGTQNPRQIKFKLFRITQGNEGPETSVRMEASHLDGNEATQITNTWRCGWQISPNQLRLKRIEITSFEETSISIPGGKLFADCTESILGHNRSYNGQMLPGIVHWLTRIPREFIDQFGHQGIAVGDVNGDGLDDLYVCDAGGLPNRLYVQNEDGTATDMSSESGVDILEDSTGALLVDLDNDGDQDLVVGTSPTLQIARNTGQGIFEFERAVSVNTDIFSLSAADFDSDGDLDIYLCGYDIGKRDPTNQGLPFPFPYHDANNGGENILLRNEGNLRFVAITDEVGLGANNSRFSMAAAWEDFDNDGDPDLYVANDFGRNNLYRNDHGKFTDVAATVGVEDHGSGMSVSWGDYNRDGRMDLYVGNMFSAAGNRVTFQDRFSNGVPSQTVSQLQRMARGNTLFTNRNNGQIAFEDSSLAANVEMGRWAWGSKFVDFTNDGWLDLVVANGYLTNENKDDL